MNNSDNTRYLQHTLATPIDFVGLGLHSGKAVRMTLMPAPANTGYIFYRLDEDESINQIPARWHTVTDTRLSTTVANSHGLSVSTIEHLVAALSANGVDNCRINIDGPEVPVMDGSSKPFVERIEAAGLKAQDEPRQAIVVTKTIRVDEKNASATLMPFPEFWVDMTIDFDAGVIGKQRVALPVNPQMFNQHLSTARTFGFADQVETMRKIGLALGGSLRNAVLVSDQGVENPEGLRYDNEFVRHKALDAIGDLSLTGANLVGCLVGNCSGHRLNNRVLRALLRNQDSWTLTTLEQAEKHWQDLVSGADSFAVDNAKVGILGE